MIGPEGYGDEKWIGKAQHLEYTITFENDPEHATAAAQVVTIEQQLDEDLTVQNFRLGDFGFGNYIVNVPDNVAFYSDQIDLSDSLGIVVSVTAGLDVFAGRAFWVFETLDPLTGQAPLDPFAGFLAVNDTLTHAGEGFVSYTIDPGNSVVTNDVIDAEAVITFDINEPIFTPPIFNTVDASEPVSLVTGAEVLGDSTLVISWMADDVDGSGLSYVNLFESIDDGEFGLYAGQLADTSLTVLFEAGHSYGFYTIAVDHAGNIEPDKTEAELLITPGPAPTAQIISEPVLTAQEDALYEYQMVVSLPDSVGSSDWNYELTIAPDWLSVDADGLISGLPIQADVGAHEVEVVAFTETMTTEPQNYTLTVEHVNHAPVISAAPEENAWVDSLYQAVVNAADQDSLIFGDTLIFTLLDAPDWLNVVSRAGIDVGLPNTTVSPSEGRGGADSVKPSAAQNQRQSAKIISQIGDVLPGDKVSRFLPPTALNMKNVPAINEKLDRPAPVADAEVNIPVPQKGLPQDADLVTLERKNNLHLDSLLQQSFRDEMAGRDLLIRGITDSILFEGIPTSSDLGDSVVEVLLEDGQGGSDTLSWTLTVQQVVIYGCIDPVAYNYNPDATVDDGSCHCDTILGDVDQSCTIDVIDIVQMAGFILFNEPNEYELWAADLDGDNVITVVDIVEVAGIILNPNLVKGETLSHVAVTNDGEKLSLESTGKVAGLQFSISGDFEMTESYLPEDWYIEHNEITLLLFSLDGGELRGADLFRYSGNLELESGIAVDWSGNTVDASLIVIPDEFNLRPAFPNPFNPITTLQYDLPEDVHVKLIVYDLAGREVVRLVDRQQTGGIYQVAWNADQLSSGIYFILFTAGDYTAKQKLVLLK